MYYALYEDGNKLSEEKIPGTNVNSANPSLSVSPSGTIHLAWAQTDENIFSYNYKLSGSTWDLDNEEEINNTIDESKDYR